MRRRDVLKAVPFLAGAGLLSSPFFPEQAKAADNAPLPLHYNENPRGPGPMARQAIQESISSGGRYPAPLYRSLVRLISLRERVPEDHIVLGAGSMEILHAAALAAGIAGKNILVPDPTYETVSRHAALAGAKTTSVPLARDFGLDLEAMDRRLDESIGLVFVCNPNNPTGVLMPGHYLRGYVAMWSWHCPVLVDEAYLDYADSPAKNTLVELVREERDVIVTRTFSKLHGLAGLRVGYGVARPDLAQRLRAFCDWSSVNILGLAAAQAALLDHVFQEKCIAENREAREYVIRSLEAMRLEVLPSAANFVFFRTGLHIEQFSETMRRQGILVARPFPPCLDWCRATLGTMESSRRFIRTVRNALGRA